MKLIIASHNQNKINEIKQIFAENFQEILSAKEAGLISEVEETGKTFFENAKLKAENLHLQAPDCAVLSDDSGICVDALDGLPGVISNRFCIEGNDKANRQLLLSKLANQSNRKAHFACCVVLILPTGKLFFAEGYTYGNILTEEIGNDGFGYDCIFFSDDLQKSFGQATSKEKNSVSHRGRALQKLNQTLQIFYSKSTQNLDNTNLL